MPIRHARGPDLPAIVAIYNASIPGRMATADTSPVTVQQREGWFREFDPAHRPLWVFCDGAGGDPRAWLSLRSFYGRPAYRATVEVAVYTAPEAQRQGLGRAILLGLEFLVAGDIIRTVAVAPTFTSVGVLALIVLVRTFLSFSLEVELENRLPWRSRQQP